MFKRSVILLMALLLMASFAGCGGTSAEQTQTTKSPASTPAPSVASEVKLEKTAPATVSSATSLEKDFNITQDIVVGRTFHMEVENKFTVDIKIVSGNGKTISPNDAVPGSSVTTDPQIVITLRNVSPGKDFFFHTTRGWASYYIEATSLGANDTVLTKPVSLIEGILTPNKDIVRAFVLHKESKKFNVTVGYKNLPQIQGHYTIAPEVQKAIKMTHEFVGGSNLLLSVNLINDSSEIPYGKGIVKAEFFDKLGKTIKVNDRGSLVDFEERTVWGYDYIGFKPGTSRDVTLQVPDEIADFNLYLYTQK
jgi:hypothetical protein